MRYFIAAALYLVTATAWAQAGGFCHLGTVARIVGTATVQREDRSQPATLGLRLCRGDRIVTGAGSIAELRFRDGTVITVGKDSEFAIREFRLYKHKPNVALFELARGAFRSLTGLITARPHRYEVSTTVAVIGVRGTDFWGGFGLTEGGLDVVMLEGKGVYVASAAGRVELAQPGQGTTVTSGAPSDARPWGEDKLQRAIATITP